MIRFTDIVQAAGGLGLFLLGMIVMTEGLQTLAGGAIRSALMRFTRSPLSGAITGTVGTAILQSSSATTVAAVGFVGAGLLAFPEALGIILGANIGTTVTGWLVALLGFKLELGTVVLPIILAGAVLRLFAQGRLATIGYAVAGFGLIFVGITFLQEGMSGFRGIITPETLPSEGLAGRLKLVAAGIVATVITQSSSAGVAATLAALNAGAVNFGQAASLVIGMDVGTTVTAVMASIGGSTGARRTGLSHVIYNILAAGGALLLLTPYTLLWETRGEGALERNAEVALVGFHTAFNIIAVTAVLPFARQFASLVEKMVPGRRPPLTRGLDRTLLSQPDVAIRVVPPAVIGEFASLLGHVKHILGDTGAEGRTDLSELQSAIDETSAYIDGIHLGEEEEPNWRMLIALIHTIDHLRRLHERCEEEEDRAVTARSTAELAEHSRGLVEAIDDILADLEGKRWASAAKRARERASEIHRVVQPFRQTVMARVAAGEIDVPESTRCYEAIRWLRRVSRHIARITRYLDEAIHASGR